MIQRHRRIIFFFFVVTFFITTGIILFHTFGYRFSFERGIFIYTGSISIKSTPETVDIRIDGEFIPQRSLGILNKSIHIAGLTPGEHFIEVSAPDHLTWSKKAVVQSGRSTEFWNVLLPKINPAPETITNTDHTIKLFRALEDGLFAVVKKIDEEYIFDVLDTKTQQNGRIFATKEASFSSENPENIEWAPESHKLIIPLFRKDNGMRIYTVVDRATDTTFDLNAFAGIEDPLRTPRWDPTTRNFLFFLSGTTLYRIDTEAPETPPTRVRENIATYDISGQNIYYLSNENGVVYRTPIAKTSEEPAQVTQGVVSISPEANYSLVIYDEDRLTLLDRTTGTLAVFNKKITGSPVHVLGTDIQGIQFSDDGKKLLFFTNNEISVYFYNDWEVQPVRTLDTTTQIARFSSPVKYVQWTEDYEHILFSLNGNVKIAELDNRDRRNFFDIASFPAPLLQVLTRFEENRLYFIRSDISEKDNVETILFPEAPVIFGFR